MSATLRLFDPTGSTSTPDRLPGKTVFQVIDWFRRSRQCQSISPVALKERQRLWNIFISEFGDSLVSECKRYQLLEWIDKHAGDLANNTRRRWAATIQLPFNKAAELDFIPSNPFFGLKMPRGDKGRDWTESEYQSVIRHTRNVPFRRFVIAIRISGMRPGEVAMIKWSHLQSEGEGWKIVFEAKEHKTGKLTGESRSLPVSKRMMKLFDWLRRNNPPGTNHVFLNSHGTPWKTRSWTKNLDTSRTKAGLSKQVKCHGGRHTFITHAQLSGVGIASVAEIVGHKSITTTADGYTHMGGKVAHLAKAMEEAVPMRTPKRSAPSKQNDDHCPLFENTD